MTGYRPLAALIGTAVVAALAALACQMGEDNGGEILIAILSPTPTPTAKPLPVPTPTPTPTPVPDVCGFNPDPAQASVMQVQEPRPRAALRSPAHVRGWGADIGREERGVVVALVNAEGGIIVVEDGPPLPRQGRIPPSGLKVGEFAAPFAVDLRFSVGRPQAVCLWVFEQKEGDPSPIHVVQVPVLLLPRR